MREGKAQVNLFEHRRLLWDELMDKWDKLKAQDERDIRAAKMLERALRDDTEEAHMMTLDKLKLGDENETLELCPEDDGRLYVDVNNGWEGLGMYITPAQATAVRDWLNQFLESVKGRTQG